MTLPALYEGKQLDLIRRTVAKDCNETEFNLFIENCKALRLDPLRRQIYAFVFSKNDAEKRQMTIVTSIGGYRSIAERTGNYRPGPTSVTLDPEMIDAATNPLGISHAEATVYKYVHGEWHPVTETAHWSEFAPLKDVWENQKKTGKRVLDPKKDGWHRMPRVMISKCAEAAALRRAWPDDFANVYAEDELDRSMALDLTATELADTAAEQKRFAAIGGAHAITVDWCDGEPLRREPVGSFGDKVLAFIKANNDAPMTIAAFRSRNADSLKEYWAKDKDGALALKVAFDAAEKVALEAAE